MMGARKGSQSADSHACMNGTAALTLHMGLPRKYSTRAARTLKAANPGKYYTLTPNQAVA